MIYTHMAYACRQSTRHRCMRNSSTTDTKDRLESCIPDRVWRIFVLKMSKDIQAPQELPFHQVSVDSILLCMFDDSESSELITVDNWKHWTIITIFTRVFTEANSISWPHSCMHSMHIQVYMEVPQQTIGDWRDMDYKFSLHLHAYDG